MTEKLPRFSLDFPGGTPRELVAALEKAKRRPLNVIVQEEDAQTQIPAFKVQNVDVEQLFQALSTASRKREAVGSQGLYGPPQIEETGYAFTAASSHGTENTIWIFKVIKPALPPLKAPRKFCRFYSLAPYLERGMTLDDITTAAETGWKMLGETSKPEISYHKETKLLIAVGEPDKLEVIDGVLKALQSAKPAPMPESAAKPKADEKR